ncbi:hypothetical protein AAET14_004440 [Escherichia coli]|nr:hypothetical protein [Escherichia coli]HDQ6556624.1 hypothetical protein [Escherichia coli O103:H25]EET9459942.1 hypothetical protein [Escherichia coli]EEZ1236223.1 hypothetical protein [Escherichia coli]EFI2516574.1 hypothetical protein [Escherichia coli]
MPVINSVCLRGTLGMHVSGNEMKDISRRYSNGNVNNGDAHFNKDVNRVLRTINHTKKSKCHEMADFLKSMKGTSYYTPAVKRALNEYVIRHVCSEKAKNAIKEYTGAGHKNLNYFLKTGLPLDGTMQEIVEGLNEVFSKNPNSDYVLKTFNGSPHKTRLSEVKEGETIVVKGYLSTSRDVNVAHSFMEEFEEFEIFPVFALPTLNAEGELNVIFGKSHCDISGLSVFKREKEELYPHGVEFRKLFQCVHKGITINVLEEVSEDLGDFRSGDLRKVKSAFF